MSVPSRILQLFVCVEALAGALRQDLQPQEDAAIMATAGEAPAATASEGAGSGTAAAQVGVDAGSRCKDGVRSESDPFPGSN